MSGTHHTNYFLIMNISTLYWVVDDRSIGKTFSFKKHLLKRFLKHGEQFIYLRRTQTELDLIDKESFFTEEMLRQSFDGFIMGEVKTTSRMTTIEFTAIGYENCLIEITGRKIMFNGKVLCYMKALSTWVKLKGSEYDKVMTILFDEVLIDKTSKYSSYLPNEVEALLKLVWSVFRKRLGCKIYLLSNSTNPNNPYFVWLKLSGQENKKRFVHKKTYRALIEFPPNRAMKEEGEENPLFALMSNTTLIETDVNNEFQEDYSSNVGKKKGKKYLLYSIYCDGTFMSVYNSGGNMYIAKGYNKNLKVYTFKKEDVDNGFTFISRSDGISKHLRKNFYQNNLHYEDMNTKFIFQNSIQKII